MWSRDPTCTPDCTTSNFYFFQTDKLTYDGFHTWLLENENFSEVTKWLLLEQRSSKRLRLSSVDDTPSFYQSLGKITKRKSWQSINFYSLCFDTQPNVVWHVYRDKLWDFISTNLHILFAHGFERILPPIFGKWIRQKGDGILYKWEMLFSRYLAKSALNVRDRKSALNVRDRKSLGSKCVEMGDVVLSKFRHIRSEGLWW